MVKGSRRTSEPLAFSPYSGAWWKFSKYEIADGYIGPAPDAELEEYDPWQRYLEARATRKDRDPPYRALLALVEHLDADACRGLNFAGPGDVDLDSSLKKKLLVWCKLHGLLGLLPQLYSRIACPPAVFAAVEGGGGADKIKVRLIWVRYMWGPQGWGRLEKRMDVAPSDARQFFQKVRAGGWVAEVESPPEGDEFSVQSGSHLWSGVVPDELVSPDVMLRGRLSPESRAYATSLGTYVGDMGVDDAFVSSRRLVSAFFPEKRGRENVAHIPEPHTEGFWGEYREPVGMFFAWALRLRLAIEALRGEAPTWGRLGYGSPNVSDGKRLLDALVWSVRPTLDVNTAGQFEQQWSAPSLFSSLSMMMYLDLVEGGSIKLCAACGTPFTARDYRTQYCSHRCQNTAQKRRQRMRQRR